MALVKSFAMAVTLALAAVPARAVDEEALTSARQVLEICMAKVSDSRAARAAFEAAGLRHEGVFGGYHAYGAKHWRFLALVSATRTVTKLPGCGVVVDKLSVAGAERLAEGVAKAHGGRKLTHTKTRNGPLSIYGAMIGSKAMGLAVFDTIDVYIVRGAMIAVKEMPIRK